MARIFFALFFLCCLTESAAAQSYKYIAKFREGTVPGDAFGAGVSQLGGSRIGSLELINAEVLSFAAQPQAADLNSLVAQSGGALSYIEPDYPVEASTMPNDPLFLRQWGLHNTGESGVADVDINAPEAWVRTTGKASVTVAVLDTGIDYTHPDLRDNAWHNAQEIPANGRDDDRNGIVDDVFGANTITGSGQVRDDQGHGTHVAGIIGALGGNAEGIAGVAWDVNLVAVKALDRNGRGSIASIVLGIQYIINLKTFQGLDVRIINASLGSPQYSQAMYDALLRARSAGILVVAAAGNEGRNIDDVPIYPAAYDLDNIISVAALDPSGDLAPFSNFGSHSVDTAAPGVDILSTWPTDMTPAGYLPYAYLSGTSMAAPFVSGIAALLHSRVDGLTALMARSRLLHGMRRNIPVPGGFPIFPGLYTGFADAVGALGELEAEDWDSDGDGVSDKLEQWGGTDPLDRGAFLLYLKSPVFAKYNTFLNQNNFLELISDGREAVQAEINVFGIDGAHVTAFIIRLEPGQQFHVDINALVKKADTYGLIRVDFNDGQSVRLHGRMTHYRPDADKENFSFAFTRELRSPMQGPSYASSNSMDPRGGSVPVAAWAEIINLEDSPKRFTHAVYAQDGQLLSRRTIDLPPLGEFDSQAGHEFGQGVYLNEFIPHDPEARYLASAARYRWNESHTDYSYAFALDAVAPTGSEKYVPAFNGHGTCWSESGWVEVVNTSDQVAPVTIMFRDSSGNLVGTQAAHLAPKSQQHFNAGALLPSGGHGWVSITPWIKDSIVAQGLTYYHDCARNAVQTAFAVPAMVGQRGDLFGTFNRFLGMDNRISVVHPGTAGDAAYRELEVYYPADRIVFELQPGPLHSVLGSINTEEGFDTTAYGTLILLDYAKQTPMVAHNLLTRERKDGRMNFVIPTIIQ